MTDKEKIKAEIERLIEQKDENTYLGILKTEAYKDVLSFIDSMQEEPVSEDLEQAIDTYLATYFGGEKEKQDWPFLKKMAIHFANWQKEQMIKEAKDGVITFDYYGDNDKIFGCIAHDSFSLEELGLKDGDKVKLIIIKEDEQ